jgi:hypothetical protein
LNLAPPQKSSKFVDESTTLPLHTSKMLDGLHKLLPLLLHTKKKRIGLFIPRLGRLWRFSPIFSMFFRFFPDFFKKKNALFSLTKKSRFFSTFAD